jgi:hypothetical protein
MLSADHERPSLLELDSSDEAEASLPPEHKATVQKASAPKAERTQLAIVHESPEQYEPSGQKIEPDRDFDDSGAEKTMRLVVNSQGEKASIEKSVIDPAAVTEVRSGGARGSASSPFQAHSPSGASYSVSAEAVLKQSESLRIAQDRITALEQELERLRRENEQLATAGETLRRRSDELLAKSEAIEVSAREAQRIFEEEKKVLRGQLHQKDRDAVELRSRLDEMEGRLENNFKKIRVRERELEHRLEIVKMESATLVSTKDKMILELKRQIDHLSHENDYAKQKTQELFNQYKDKQETIRRVVRALRIALTILEGDDESAQSKKAE